MQKRAFKDVRDWAKDFRRGDVVYPINPRDGSTGDISGIVTAVHLGIGFVDVEFAWGNKRLQADEIVRIIPGGETPLPPSKDTSYSGWDVNRSRLNDRTLPRVASLANDWIEHIYNVRAAAAKRYVEGDDRHTALANVLQSVTRTKTHEVKAAVEHVYDYIPKQALYWSAPGRQYRPSRAELESGDYTCPRCKEALGKAIYRKGARLYSCVNCLFMISPDDIFTPDEVRAASYAHDKLASALGDRSDWVVAHAPGLAAAFHGPYGMSFSDGMWKVIGADGSVVETVATPRQAYDAVMLLKDAGRRVNNDAEELIRVLMESPDPEKGVAQKEMRHSAPERQEALINDLSDPDFSRLDFYRQASQLAQRLVDAAESLEAGMADSAYAQSVLAESTDLIEAR